MAQHLKNAPETVLFALVDGLQYERFFSDELLFKPHVSMPLFNKYPDSLIAFAGPWIIRISEIDLLCWRRHCLQFHGLLPAHLYLN
ncbi:TPA: hypothetical protein R5S02_004632 [Salmonella enterica]|nr:hypothetical protein [Salmonella enterica]